MHSWPLWVLGWLCWIGAAYLQFQTPGALAIAGLALTRASGIMPEATSPSAVLSSLLGLFKGAVGK